MTNHNSALVDTIPALAGVIFTITSAVQFLDTSITVGVIGYSVQPAHSFVISLVALLVAFGYSETRDWDYYESWEQVLVAVTLLIMTSHQFVPVISRTVSNQNPVAGSLVFTLGVAAWGVISR